MYGTTANILQLKELGVTLAGTLPIIRERHISKYALCKSDPVLFIYSYTELHQLSMTDIAHKYVAKKLRSGYLSGSGHQFHQAIRPVPIAWSCSSGTIRPTVSPITRVSNTLAV